MSNEQEADTTEKRGPGRPKRQPVHRGLRREPLHRGPRNDAGYGDRIEKYEFHPYEAQDKFYIPKDVIDSIERDWGQALMWMALEIMGKPNEFIPGRRRNQWEEVRAGDFEGQFDHFGIKDGIIRIEGMALFRQPIEIHRKARAYDKRQADAPIRDNIRKHSETGVDGITMPGGGEHPSARAQNRIRTSYEPGPRIPD
jgi:hypothetical protein